MNEYIILSHPSESLDISLCAHAVDAVIKTLLYKGSCLYMPLPGLAGSILLTLDTGDATESETDWFLRTLSGYLGARLLDTDGGSIFEGSADNDIDGIDIVPPPEDECLPIRLFFSFDNIEHQNIRQAVMRFFYENEYDVTGESDGFTVFMASNSYLDIFYKEGDTTLTGEMECTFSGAGVFAEAVELAEALGTVLGTVPSFVTDESITYTSDKDFDKLRRAFYAPLRQQLAFAINDDRDGLQAYIGWGTDAFEPKPIRGTVITPFGRYDIERLLEEIKTYGFSNVCDRRFLTRNTPTDSADFYIKEVMNIVWSTSFLNPNAELSKESMLAVKACTDDFETALTLDKYAPFPSEVYHRLCRRIGKKAMDTSKSRDYMLHYEPGYMQNEVAYGFGHYLRRFKLPGYFAQCCKADFRDRVYFHESLTHGIRIEVEISYGYTGDGTDSPLGGNFAIGEDIHTFDIGGSSVVRYVDGGKVGDRYRAEAEIYIKDEVYRFAMSGEREEDVEWFCDTVRSCISVEDWYDEYIREESPDPHAPGGTFCMNITAPECNAFTSAFPTGNIFLTHNRIAAAGPDGIGLPNDAKDFIAHIMDMMKKEDKDTDTE